MSTASCRDGMTAVLILLHPPLFQSCWPPLQILSSPCAHPADRAGEQRGEGGRGRAERERREGMEAKGEELCW